MRDDYLFVIRKSIFANNQKIFFFFLTAFDFIIVALLGDVLTSSFIEEIFGMVIPQAIWNFLASPAYSIVMYVCAFISLLIGTIIIIDLKTYKMIFYKDRIVIQGGLIARLERQIPLTPILGVHMEQGFWGRVFDYASFVVERVGTEDWNLEADAKIGEVNGYEGALFRVADAAAVKECLEEMIIITRDDITAVVGNHAGKVEKPLSERMARIVPNAD